RVAELTTRSVPEPASSTGQGLALEQLIRRHASNVLWFRFARFYLARSVFNPGFAPRGFNFAGLSPFTSIAFPSPMIFLTTSSGICSKCVFTFATIGSHPFESDFTVANCKRYGSDLLVN